jgi:hypothetical protein
MVWPAPAPGGGSASSAFAWGVPPGGRKARTRDASALLSKAESSALLAIAMRQNGGISSAGGTLSLPIGFVYTHTRQRSMSCVGQAPRPELATAPAIAIDRLWLLVFFFVFSLVF